MTTSLFDKKEPWGIIKFIHKDGKEHEFYTCVNILSRSRLSAFDGDPPDIGESMAYIKSVFRDIYLKAKVLSYEGTKHFEKEKLTKKTK